MGKLEIYIRGRLVHVVYDGHENYEFGTCVSLNEDVDGDVKTYSIEVYAFGDEVYQCKTDAFIRFTDVELRYIKDD